jgi:hypothetical protein
MNCPNCQEPVEDGAAFCGSCGQPLAGRHDMTAAVPGYALAVPSRHAGETKALLSFLFGTIGIIGSVFIALFGLVLGVAGLIMGTLSRASPKHVLSTLGLIASSLSILAGLAVWVYAANHDSKLDRGPASATQTPAVTTTASGLATPCYSFNFVDSLQISNNKVNCDMQAFNGRTFAASSDVYKIYASRSRATTVSGFNALAKKALETDVKTNLKGFTLAREQVTTFAGSPAYVVNAVDDVHHIAVIEAAVFHQSPTGENTFIILHANSGATSDLQVLESQWQWK